MKSNLNSESRILITGAAGFIGSAMASFLNQNGFENLFLVDDFSQQKKIKNHEGLKCVEKIDRDLLENYLAESAPMQFVIHFGARTDTTEMDYAIHEKLNLIYSKMIWNYCATQQIPLVYASSAATYGDGAFGYEDNENEIEKLKPLNPYGVSKNEFDKWVLKELKNANSLPPFWYGLKFFNVYGPNEYHKGRMASVIFHAYSQIKKTGQITLFRSHHPDFEDGKQQRDFIYVKDILKVTDWLLHQLPKNGIYNLGTGHARTFIELAEAIFKTLSMPKEIHFIDTPLDIREKYQYFTEAKMQKLHNIGYPGNFFTLEEGVEDYIKNYLSKQAIF